MCLAVPGKVVEIIGDDPLLRSAKVSFSGVIKLVSLTCTPEAKLGDYVLVHVGVAISTVDPEEAAQTFEYLKQMGELDGIELPASPEASLQDEPRRLVSPKQSEGGSSQSGGGQ
jgi:hydrogenase expression/formation protein HypC